MSQPENKRNVAPPKNSVPNEASQRTVFFAELNKEQYPETDISPSIEVLEFYKKFGGNLRLFQSFISGVPHIIGHVLA